MKKRETPKLETPWGMADSVKTIAKGIIFVSTPGHGGFRLDQKRQAKVPDYMRTPDGWYEEDCEWSIVATVFPECFSETNLGLAKKTLKNYYPDSFAKFYESV